MSNFAAGIADFIQSAGWSGAHVNPLPGDASFRRYFRLTLGDRTAMLMHAPPPHEDPVPFLDAADWLSTNGHRAPEIYAKDVTNGWVLIEDFGDARMRDWLDLHPQGEFGAYSAAIDALVSLHRSAPGPFGPYDQAVYMREVALFTEWYCPAAGLSVDVPSFESAWTAVLGPLIAAQNENPVTVLRDYHAENIMLLAPDDVGNGAQGLIDFQDALVGHAAYDLVSLLQDARREVSPELEASMLERYRSHGVVNARFDADYAILGAQRNIKIVGIFTRLAQRDGKARYLDMIPRVWMAMERDLNHPELAPIADWFARNVPCELRARHGALGI